MTAIELDLQKHPPKILCLDDEESVLRSLARLLRHHGMEIETFTSGFEALAALEKDDFEVIISDMRMPQMTGDVFLAKTKALSPDSQRILLTGYSDFSSTVNAVNEGGIHFYLQKPWQNEHLLSTVKEAVEKYRLKKQNAELQEKVKKQNAELKELNQSLEQLVEKRTSQIKQVLKQLEVAHEHEKKEHKSTVEVLYNFINANPYLDADFAQSVATTCAQIAKKLKLSEHLVETARMAGYLAQVGLLAMDPAIYRHPVAQLDENKRKIYFTHPATAQLMLMPATHLHEVSEAIYHQFEKYNGNGIPKGLKEHEIPVCAHILAVARDYWQYIKDSNKPMNERKETSLEMLKMYSGNFYHPKMVKALIAVLADAKTSQAQHVGSMDIISSQELKAGMVLGLAIHSNKGIMLLPKGHVFSDKSIAKLQQLESQRPNPFRIMVK
ncbi:response regulator (plasmid) [Pseudoalteromonas xiamenensis]|uniref:HD domain-containing phosphohydrolase n=1 Tax=Pseudoalteromonas xiamenensis TaxID=882626 RepID=UPI0027E4FFE5|nr:HD domain-containing phosphohydrolase [Pseudoalteromonas xiamenensis]WMN61783.1 response regulator [Pseudoalteromonas xiamenensis]